MNVPALVGSLAGVLLLAVCALGLFLWWRRRRRQRRQAKKAPKLWHITSYFQTINDVAPTSFGSSRAFSPDEEQSSRPLTREASTSVVDEQAVRKHLRDMLALGPATTSMAAPDLERKYGHAWMQSNQIELNHLLGSGANGQVYAGMHRGVPAAFKVINQSQPCVAALAFIRKTVLPMVRVQNAPDFPLGHPHLLPLIDCLVFPPWYAILELAREKGVRCDIVEPNAPGMRTNRSDSLQNYIARLNMMHHASAELSTSEDVPIFMLEDSDGTGFSPSDGVVPTIHEGQRASLDHDKAVLLQPAARSSTSEGAGSLGFGASILAEHPNAVDGETSALRSPSPLLPDHIALSVRSNSANAAATPQRTSVISTTKTQLPCGRAVPYHRDTPGRCALRGSIDAIPYPTPHTLYDDASTTPNESPFIRTAPALDGLDNTPALADGIVTRSSFDGQQHAFPPGPSPLRSVQTRYDAPEQAGQGARRPSDHPPLPPASKSASLGSLPPMSQPDAAQRFQEKPLNLAPLSLTGVARFASASPNSADIPQVPTSSALVYAEPSFGDILANSNALRAELASVSSRRTSRETDIVLGPFLFGGGPGTPRGVIAPPRPREVELLAGESEIAAFSSGPSTHISYDAEGRSHGTGSRSLPSNPVNALMEPEEVSALASASSLPVDGQRRGKRGPSQWFNLFENSKAPVVPAKLEAAKAPEAPAARRESASRRAEQDVPIPFQVIMIMPLCDLGTLSAFIEGRTKMPISCLPSELKKGTMGHLVVNVRTSISEVSPEPPVSFHNEDNCAIVDLPAVWQTVLKLQLCLQVVDGVMALHAAKLVHCDIKPDNVMLSVDQAFKPFGICAKVGDMDTCRSLKGAHHDNLRRTRTATCRQLQNIVPDPSRGGSSDTTRSRNSPGGDTIMSPAISTSSVSATSVSVNSVRSTTSHFTTCLKGTPGFLSPEMILQGKVAPTTDVFSLAITVSIMLSRRHRFLQYDDLHIRSIPEFLDSIGPDLVQVLSDCVLPDPRARPSLEHLRGVLQAQFVRMLEQASGDEVATLTAR